MKIAIISDTHDNLTTLAKFFDYLKEYPADFLIHCGDVANAETLNYIATKFSGQIYVAQGNMDGEHKLETAVKKISAVHYFNSFGETKIDGLKIGFCHHPETGQFHLEKERFDYIFYGHTHKPWEEKINGCYFANPGNLAGILYRATFAILDSKTRKLELKIINQLTKNL